MAEHRRDALRIIGAISSTCAFPFQADELFDQHQHEPGAAASLPQSPRFYTAAEYAIVKRIADLIIPATGTPGALAAGVPAYIDYVVSNNPRAQRLHRQGLAWLEAHARRRHGKRFADLEESHQVAILAPLCDQADRAPLPAGPRTGGLSPRPAWKAPLGVRFFHSIKSMTADGFFTSKPGLVDTLRYQGNTVRSEFPACTHEH
jgi:hypothetical protein